MTNPAQPHALDGSPLRLVEADRASYELDPDLRGIAALFRSLFRHDRLSGRRGEVARLLFLAAQPADGGRILQAAKASKCRADHVVGVG